jgi:hypothetical protein
VRRELAQSKSFTAADRFPVGRERLPIPKEVSFSRDLWKAETGKISYAEVVAMNGAGRGGGRGGVLAFDGAQLTREIILLRSPATAPEKELLMPS